MSREFEIGQRVERPTDVFRESPMRYGVIVERYGARNRVCGNTWYDPELYAVKWDDTGLTDRGYFRHGLQAVAVKL